jgi:hypothetical protein
MDETAALRIECVLCEAHAELFCSASGRRFYRCGRCLAVFLAPECRVSLERERERYLLHRNDIGNVGYLEFLSPLVRAVERSFSAGQSGLDFGSGPVPVLSQLLKEKGYALEQYDPFFCDRPQALEKKYDFIVCCEVAEHFYAPAKEFERLRSLLNDGGVLFCMTELYCEGTDFGSWYYKNDMTHVTFYHRDTLAWIKSRFGFSQLEIEGRLQILTA